MSATTITAEAAQQQWRKGIFTPHQVVTGILDYSADKGAGLPERFPEHLTVDVLDLSGRSQVQLPNGLTCYELNLSVARMWCTCQLICVWNHDWICQIATIWNLCQMV